MSKCSGCAVDVVTVKHHRLLSVGLTKKFPRSSSGRVSIAVEASRCGRFGTISKTNLLEQSKSTPNRRPIDGEVGRPSSIFKRDFQVFQGVAGKTSRLGTCRVVEEDDLARSPSPTSFSSNPRKSNSAIGQSISGLCRLIPGRRCPRPSYRLPRLAPARALSTLISRHTSCFQDGKWGADF